MKKRTWAGRRVWLLGASSGIGAALAGQLSQAGAEVIISARRADALAMVAHGHERMIALPCDITDADACQQVATHIAREYGDLDTVIINAGQCEYMDVAVFDAAVVQRIHAVNFQGAVNVVAAALPLLRKAPSNRQPCIMAVSSLATRLPFTRAEAYGASKAALDYFLASLSVDLHAEGIEVITVSPGFVETPMTAQNDFAMPWQLPAGEAAQRIVQGFCRGKRWIAFPWPLVMVLGALSRLPLSWQVVIARRMARAQAANPREVTS